MNFLCSRKLPRRGFGKFPSVVTNGSLSSLRHLPCDTNLRASRFRAVILVKFRIFLNNVLPSVSWCLYFYVISQNLSIPDIFHHCTQFSFYSLDARNFLCRPQPRFGWDLRENPSQTWEGNERTSLWTQLITTTTSLWALISKTVLVLQKWNCFFSGVFYFAYFGVSTARCA